MRKALLAAALLLFVALAGCAGSKGDTSDVSGTSSTSGTRTSTTATPAANTPPSGSLSLSTSGGELPLAVNITLTGQDADGDNLTWALDFGDGNATNGTALPAELLHNYTSAGNFTVLFTLSDGKSNATYNATLTVSAASVNAATQEASGSWSVGLAACPHVFVGTYEDTTADQLAAGNGRSWSIFAIDPATWGATWTVLASASSGNPTGEETLELDFYDTAGVYMEYNSGSFGEAFSGTVPADAGYGVLFPCSGPGSFTYAAAFL
jgi:PKD repeat protein